MKIIEKIEGGGVETADIRDLRRILRSRLKS